jgi:hypothetical protein
MRPVADSSRQHRRARNTASTRSRQVAHPPRSQLALPVLWRALGSGTTPGFEYWGWPPVEGMSLDANRGDLARGTPNLNDLPSCVRESVDQLDHDIRRGLVVLARDDEHGYLS